MEDEHDQAPPTGNLINLELCTLMHTASEEVQPGPSTEPSTTELKQLKADLESTLGDLIQHEHHKQFMLSALQANKPPPLANTQDQPKG